MKGIRSMHMLQPHHVSTQAVQALVKWGCAPGTRENEREKITPCGKGVPAPAAAAHATPQSILGGMPSMHTPGDMPMIAACSRCTSSGRLRRIQTMRSTPSMWRLISLHTWISMVGVRFQGCRQV